jgi:hypothetical protein
VWRAVSRVPQDQFRGAGHCLQPGRFVQPALHTCAATRRSPHPLRATHRCGNAAARVPTSCHLSPERLPRPRSRYRGRILVKARAGGHCQYVERDIARRSVHGINEVLPHRPTDLLLNGRAWHSPVSFVLEPGCHPGVRAHNGRPLWGLRGQDSFYAGQRCLCISDPIFREINLVARPLRLGVL